MYPKYPRPASPTGRRMAVPERSSTGNVGYSSYEPQYNRPRQGSYTSPRSSAERVIPISEETYVNGVPVSKRTSGNYDSYNNAARRAPGDRSSYTGGESVTSPTRPSNRARAAIVHNDSERPSSPRRVYDYDRGYYPVPASSASRRNYSKDYEVDDRRSSRNLDDRDRDGKRPGDYGSSKDSKGYHLSGPISRPSVNDQGAYEYTDARGMYRDTEPRWRPRRTSADAATSDRPASTIEGFPNRSGARDRPPPTTRGLERLNAGVGRQSSLREPVRSPPGQRERGFSYSEDDANVPRRSAARPSALSYERDDSRNTSDDYDESRESRAEKRWQDTEVASRGFGIRSGSFDPPRSRDESYERRSGYARASSKDEYGPDISRSDRRREPEPGSREPVAEKERDLDKERDIIREKERELAREKDRERELEEDIRARRRDHGRERERDERDFDDRRNADKDRYGDGDRQDRRERSEKKGEDDGSHSSSGLLPAAALGATAAGLAGERYKRRGDRSSDVSNEHDEDDYDTVPEKPSTRDVPQKETSEYIDRAEEPERKRERHYVREDRDDQATSGRTEAVDPDEEYRQRMQKELERAKQSKAQAATREQPRSEAPVNEAPRSETGRPDSYDAEYSQDVDKSSTADRYKPRADPGLSNPSYESREKLPAADRYKPREYLEAERRRGPSPVGSDIDQDDSRALMRVSTDDPSILSGAPPSDEPAQIIENRENRVRIVEPPKEKDLPKSILRKPTQKFPEDPHPIREGVAPLKDATKKGIPPGARWTKIDRRLVNPEALHEAQERFEERQDCVIVLRVLTKEEIQKFADRTKELRDERHEHSHSRRHKHKDYDGTDESEGERDDRSSKPKQIGWER